jgi:hypothetical protein
MPNPGWMTTAGLFGIMAAPESCQHPRNDVPAARVITLRDLDAEPPPAL